MLDAAQEALSFAEGTSSDDLYKDRMLALSLVKSIEIIGEAASQVSPVTKDRTSSIPWADIVGMRNRLIHAYFDIDLDIVWRTVVDELPPLVTELERILGRETEEESSF